MATRAIPRHHRNLRLDGEMTNVGTVRPLGQMVAAATAEVRSLRRSARLWLVAGSVTITGLAGFYYVARQHAVFSSLSSVLGTPGPRYLLSGFGTPLLVVALLGVICLLVDTRHRENRDQVADVLDSRPVSNFALLAGRCIAVCGAAWLSVILAVTAIQAWGWVARHVGWDLGEPVQLASLAAFVFVDCLPALVVCCSFICLLVAAFRNRLVVVLSGVAVLCLHHWALFNTPIHLLPVATLFPSFGKPVSDILPEFPDGQDIAFRTPWLLLAGGLLVLAAVTYPRRDCGSWAGPRLGALGTVLALIGVSGLVLMIALRTDGIARRGEWERAHRALQDEPRASLRHVAGRVDMDPGTRLDLDLEMSLAAPSRTPSRRLLFSFNPGMRVQQLAINGDPVAHRHDRGVLWVEPKQAIAPGTVFAMAIDASGTPDPRFAYLDSAILPQAETWADSRLALLGTEGSIFEDAYVALLPGSRWLPNPGPNFSPPGWEARLPYTVDLEVVAPPGWHLAGPGKHVDDGSIRLRPGAPLPEVALFAAPFSRFAAQIENIDVELLVSPRHASNVQLFANDHERVVDSLQRLFRQARNLGIPYPYGSLQVIEVPAQLRTFGGGWRMDSLSSLPGVALLREHGFPAARFDHPASREPNVGSLQFFFDQHGSHDLLASASRNLFTFVASPKGNDALVIDFVLADLVTKLLNLRGDFSTYAFEWADTSLVPTLPHWLVLMVGDTLGASNPSGWWRTCAPPEAVSAAALVNLQFDVAPELALCLLSIRSLAASRLLRDTLGTEGAGALLAELRGAHGGTFDATDFASSVGRGPAMLEPVIGHLLGQRDLPGFLASQVELIRVADDGQGLPRYQARVHIRNDEPIPGFVRLEWGTASGGGDFLDWHTGEPVPIPGDSSVEIGFVSSEPLEDVWLLSYLSKNRQDLRLSLRELGTESIAEPFAGFRASEWRPQGGTGIVVDDLDPGFAVEVPPSANFLPRLARALGLGVRFEMIQTDTGLPLYRRMMGADQFVRRADRRVGWWRQEFASAWGKYRRTIARGATWDRDVSAVFSATIPSRGRWRLDYHLPDLTPRPRFSRQFRSLVPIGVWDGGRQGFYDMKLFADGLEMAIEFDAANAAPGWNELSTLALEPGNVRLAVSGRSTERTVIADAIRWTPVDDNHGATPKP